MITFLLQSLQQGAPHRLLGSPLRLSFEEFESKPNYRSMFTEHAVGPGPSSQTGWGGGSPPPVLVRPMTEPSHREWEESGREPSGEVRGGGKSSGAGQPRQPGVRHRPRDPAELKRARQGSPRSSKDGPQSAASTQTAAEQRQGKGLTPSPTASLWPSWASNLGPDGFPRCAELNRRAGLN